MAWHAEVTKAPVIEERQVVAAMRLWDDATGEVLLLAQDLNSSDGPGLDAQGAILKTEILEVAAAEWRRFLNSGPELAKLPSLQLSLAPDCPAAHMWREKP